MVKLTANISTNINEAVLIIKIISTVNTKTITITEITKTWIIIKTTHKINNL